MVIPPPVRRRTSKPRPKPPRMVPAPLRQPHSFFASVAPPPVVAELLETDPESGIWIPGTPKTAGHMYNDNSQFYKALGQLASLSDEDKEKLEFLKGPTGARAAKAQKRKELIAGHPDVWRNVETDKRFKGEQNTKIGDVNMKGKLLLGSRRYLRHNIQPVLQELPLKMGFLVSNLPLDIMTGLMGQYGTQDAQQTILGGTDSRSVSYAINQGPNDCLVREAFITAATDRFQPGLQMEKAAEESLNNLELTYPAIDHLTTPQEIHDYAKVCLDKATKKSAWKGSKNLKDFQRATLDGRQCPDKEEEARLNASRALQEAFDIDPHYFRQPRAKYYFHHMDCMDDDRFFGNDVEPSEIVTAGGSPLDCGHLNHAGRQAIDKLDYLVRDCLETVFEEEKEDVQQDDQSSTKEIEWDTDKKHLAHLHTISEMKKEIAFFPGVIKTGSRQFHQDLHIDNSDLIGTAFLEKTLLHKYSALPNIDWLRAGYLIDLPLSREGSWLRVAVPCDVPVPSESASSVPKYKKSFVVHMVYIPFGSFLVRSSALFHSGHYGSPGNTRFHAMCFVKGATTNSKYLGYLTKITAPNCGSVAAGWGCQWADTSVKCYFLKNVVKFSTPAIKKLKRAGTYYFNTVVEGYHSSLPHQIWLLNPSYPPPTKEDQEADQEGAVVAVQTI